MNNFNSDEIKRIPLTFENRKLGIEKCFVTKDAFQIDFNNGGHVRTNNKSYSYIYENTEYQLINENEYLSAEYISEILSFLEEKYDLIQENINYFRGGENNGS